MTALFLSTLLFAVSQSLFWLEFSRLKKQSLEFSMLLIMAVISLIGIAFSSAWIYPVLYALCYLLLLFRWGGNFNGGSDNLTFVLLTGFFISKFSNQQGAGLTYIAILVTSSYFLAGWVKVKNKEWWTGDALAGFMAYSPYQITTWQRHFLNPAITKWMARSVLFFELTFPLALLHPVLTWIYLSTGVIFHLGNWIFFGLNRFFWVWISSYPAFIWFAH